MSNAGLGAEYDFVLKFVLTGNSGTGKSALITRFTDNNFGDNYISTVGIDFWDTAGQERFRQIVCSYYRGAHGIITVYDITNRKSFIDVPLWLDEVERYANADVCKVVVGNKVDLAAERQVDWTEAYELSNSRGGSINVIEASAKTSRNVFIDLARELMRRRANLTFIEQDAPYPSAFSIGQCSSVEYRKRNTCC